MPTLAGSVILLASGVANYSILDVPRVNYILHLTVRMRRRHWQCSKPRRLRRGHNDAPVRSIEHVLRASVLARSYD
ncbi:hypothetical protein BDW22DRAFT_1362370 [Trametopsis cervina]|nr:hypothetical protein BDW22DRAFT_1362370 [Trametopsis cervina]